MLEFYSWPRPACFTLTFLLTISVLSQTLAVIFGFYRYPRNSRWAFEALLELLVLIHIYVFSLMHGQAIQGYIFSMVPQTGYILLRIIIFSAIAILSAIIIAVNPNPFPLLIIAAAGLTLPVTEQLTGRVFAYLYTAAVLFWLSRSIRMSLIRLREIRTNISALSVKNAIDSLNTGIMFCEYDGFVLLSNTRMQRLMREVTGVVQRNGRKFHNALLSGKIQNGCQKAEYEGQIVCLLPEPQPSPHVGEGSPLDKSAWMFTRTDLLVKNKQYFQLSAADITQHWALTAQLQQQEDLLKTCGEELKEMIANLHILSRKRETHKIKMIAHDVLGGRLAMLLHAVRGEQSLDLDLLCSQTRGLLDNLKSEQTLPDPVDEFNSLKRVFGAIGVDISLEGELPEDNEKAKLILDIIREGVTNSVRHGYASQIYINVDANNGDYRLKISDNGKLRASETTSVEIKEGGGFTGMREKLRLFDGVLSFVTQPNFVLSVDIPGASKNFQRGNGDV